MGKWSKKEKKAVYAACFVGVVFGIIMGGLVPFNAKYVAVWILGTVYAGTQMLLWDWVMKNG